MRLSDKDAVVIFTLSPAGNDQRFSVSLRSTYVVHLLGKRTPNLPGWFQQIFLQLYRDAEFTVHGISLAPLMWISEGETRSARREPGLVFETFAPLLELLDDRHPLSALTDPRQRTSASAQRELFLRWAIDPNDGSRADAFWLRLDQACREPITEILLQQSLGLDSAGIMVALRDYFSDAIRHGIQWRAPEIEYPDIELHPANRVEVARIKGDWERLEADWVRRNRRDLEPHYLDLACQIVYRGGRAADSDAGLLAVRGLTELEAGDYAEADSLLAAAGRPPTQMPCSRCWSMPAPGHRK